MLVKERLQSGSWVPPWLHHQHVARYQWALQHAPGARVLDAACGNAYGSRILASESSVISLDIAADAIADARAGADPSMLKMALGDTTALPFESGIFDTYVSFETIEHVPDDRRYVAEARRVLRKGGVLLCSTPNRALSNPGNTIADAPFNPFHVREYTASELSAVLRSGFSEVTLLGQSPYSERYAGSLGWLGRRWKMGAVRVHQLRKVLSIPFHRAGRHWPAPIPRGTEPEVLIAICR